MGHGSRSHIDRRDHPVDRTARWGRDPGQAGAALVEDLPGSELLPAVTVHDFANKPSTIVVTQRTDVLKEVAFFVDRCNGASRSEHSNDTAKIWRRCRPISLRCSSPPG